MHVKALTKSQASKRRRHQQRKPTARMATQNTIRPILSKLNWNTISMLHMTLENLSCDFVHCFRPV